MQWTTGNPKECTFRLTEVTQLQSLAEMKKLRNLNSVSDEQHQTITYSQYSASIYAHISYYTQMDHV